MTGEELLKGLEREAERRRLRLVDASKQRKIFEKLRERRREELWRSSSWRRRKSWKSSLRRLVADGVTSSRATGARTTL